jgi:hypothetical protein
MKPVGIFQDNEPFPPSAGCLVSHGVVAISNGSLKAGVRDARRPIFAIRQLDDSEDAVLVLSSIKLVSVTLITDLLQALNFVFERMLSAVDAGNALFRYSFLTMMRFTIVDVWPKWNATKMPVQVV